MSKFHFIPPKPEQGAALLTVLLLVSVMAVIAATALDRLTLSTKVAANSNAILQARSYALAAEALATSRISDLLIAGGNRTTLAGDWNGQERSLPIPEGVARLRVSDSGNCFNLNSLVAVDEATNSENLIKNPIGINQFIALMNSLGISDQEARAIADASADWIDSDALASALGAEDSYYQTLNTPYRAANRLMAERSELRSVRGVTPAHYATLKPWLCALPIAALSPINVNTLLPEQAILLSMLIPQSLTLDRARSYLANRPASGYANQNAFWNAPQLADIRPSANVLQQIQVKSRWFDLEIVVNLGTVRLREKTLIDAKDEQRPLILYRNWGHAG